MGYKIGYKLCLCAVLLDKSVSRFIRFHFFFHFLFHLHFHPFTFTSTGLFGLFCSLCTSISIIKGFFLCDCWFYSYNCWKSLWMRIHSIQYSASWRICLLISWFPSSCIATSHKLKPTINCTHVLIHIVCLEIYIEYRSFYLAFNDDDDAHRRFVAC